MKRLLIVLLPLVCPWSYLVGSNLSTESDSQKTTVNPPPVDGPHSLTPQCLNACPEFLDGKPN
jgi:hypothetical protein